MSRSKPYARDTKPRDADAPWKHDMYDSTRTTLAERLHSSSASSSRRSGSSAKLLDRLSGGKGKELIASPSQSTSKLFGFDDANAKSKPNNPNARELIPDKAARATRASRPRGVADPGARNLVATSLGSVLGGRTSVVRPVDSPSSSSSSRSINIMGAAVVCVRVEFLAKGTTAEDVKSAFAPTPIIAARLCSSPRDRTATIEVDVADREAANDLVGRFDGVMADGETLRLTIVRGAGASDSRRGGNGRELTAESSSSDRLGDRLAPRRNGPPSSGKLYSDQILRSDPRAATTTVGDKPLASRFGRRR